METTASTTSAASLSLNEKKLLLEKLLQKKLQESMQTAPMSKGQESLWFVHQSDSASPAYNVASAIKIFTPVNAETMNRAVQIIMQRHASLRTSYATENGTHVQKIHASATATIVEYDARQLNEAFLQEKIKQDYELPFDLTKAPAIRVHLYQLASGESIFMVVVHHIAFDAWSLWIMMDELAEIYQSLIENRPINLPNQSAAYKAFAQSQAQYLLSEAGQASKSYWLNKLKGEIYPLTLHIAKPRPRVQTFAGNSHYFQLPVDLASGVNQLAKAQGVTTYTLMLAAFKVLLNRHSQQQDICVVSPTAGRQDPNFLRTIGYFVNPVVLRSQLDGNFPFSEFLQRVNETVLDALEHQAYPFSSLIEALNPRRDSSYSPLSQVSFVFQKSQQDGGVRSAWAPGQQGPRVEWAGLDIAQYPLNQQEGQFELELEIVEAQGTFYGILKYNDQLFAATNMQMLERHFLQILQHIVRQPTCGVQQLALLTEQEKTQQLEQWNNTQHEYPEHTSLYELIERQVALTPHAPALIFENTTLTYAELNARANQLAHYLIELGVVADARVGVCMNRSIEMVVALIAIIKAGGAYVPVDPNYPSSRVEFMLGDMGAEILLTQSGVVEQLPQTIATLITLDTLVLTQYAETNPGVSVAPHNLAYMIYTSGSTGNPKGAMNTHAAICNRLLWMQAEYQLDATDTVLQKTPFSFDVSVWEFFWPLMTGATLVVAKPDGHKDTQYLIEVINQHRVTTLHFVPSMLSIFVTDANVQTCTSIKRVICSGEALSFELQKRFFEKFSIELHNLYGPTEAAIDVTYWACRKDYAANVVPIGKPIANIAIYILDQFMQLVPQGVPGELHIGGIGLARGYHNREQLTREKFIADPFSKDPNARLYKTGDLVRYLPDGNIEYLQRIDNQVKLRGFRIELGEVEAMICGCQGVREAAVTKRTAAELGDYLVAYVTVSDSQTTEKSILAEASTKMPSHCVPSAVVVMDAMPLTPNGKVDGKALPEHSFGARTAKHLVPPRSELERKLLKIWSSTLAMEYLCVTDNFFAIGGHSLLAVRLMAAIEAELGEKLPLSALIANPSIESLALLIESPLKQQKSLIAIRDQGNKTPMFFIPGGGGNVLYYYALAQHLGEDQPFYAMQAVGLDGVTPPLSTVQEMAKATIQEIKQVQPQGPYLIGGHCVGSLIAYEITQQLIANGDEIQQLFVLDAPAPHFFAQKKTLQ